MEEMERGTGSLPSYLLPCSSFDEEQGKLKCRARVTFGRDSCVDAFIGMLRGENFGKTMLQI